MQKPYGYPVSSGYLGWVEDLGRWVLFSTEAEYVEYISNA